MSLLILVLSGLFFFSYHNYGLAPFDEGVLLEGIRLAAEGRMDASRFLHYSIQYDAFAALFPDGDPNLEVLRLVWVVVRALTAWLILLIGVRLLPLRWSLVPVLFFLALPGPWHKALVAFSVCLCLHAMLRAVEKGRQRDAIQLGLCLALAFALHPYTGVLSTIAWGLLVVTDPSARAGGVGDRPPRDAVLWHGTVAIATIGGALVMAPFLRQISPFSLIGQNAGLTLSILPGSRLFAAQLRGWVSRPDLALTLSVYFAFLVVLIGALWLGWFGSGRHQSRHRQTVLLIFAVVGALNMAKWLVRLDLAHLLQNAAPFWVLLVVGLRWLTNRARKPGGTLFVRGRARTTAVLAWLWVLVVMVFGFASSDTFVGGIGTRIGTDTVPLAHPHGTLYVRPEVAHTLGDLNELIRTNSNDGDTLLVSALPKILHYLSQRPSPTLAPAFAFPAIFTTNPVTEIVDSIRKARTPLIVYSPEPIIPIEAYRLENLAPELHLLITDDYELIAEVSRLQLRAIRSSDNPSVADATADSQPAENRQP